MDRTWEMEFHTYFLTLADLPQQLVIKGDTEVKKEKGGKFIRIGKTQVDNKVGAEVVGTTHELAILCVKVAMGYGRLVQQEESHR